MRKRRISVAAGSFSASNGYEIVIDGGQYPWRYLSELVKSYTLKRRKLALITDTKLKRQYKEPLSRLAKQGLVSMAIPAGETSKQAFMKERIEAFLFRRNFNRKSALIAFGGGVVGDLCGFTAATFMRGIAWYGVPSTIVAMADSSIGGKTGIDTADYGKNLIGSFHNPKEVYMALPLLQSLPEKVYRFGLAEVAKHAFIAADTGLYHFIQKNIVAMQRRDIRVLSKVIEANVKIKRAVVLLDERETGIRRTLNFGHTVGHALEWLSKYSMQHGEAVSIGMAAEAFLSMQLGLLAEKELKRIWSLLEALRLPRRLPSWSHTKLKQLYTSCLLDKKAEDKEFRFSAIEAIGKMHIAKDLYLATVKKREFLRFMRAFIAYSM